MMTFIRNRRELLNHGEVELRRIALDIVEHVLRAVHPYLAVKSQVLLDRDRLTVADRTYRLGAEDRVFVVGAGKATFPIAQALDEILADRIAAGLVVCKHGQEGTLRHIGLHLAGHPVPDESSLEGARKTVDLLSQVGPGDIVIACFTGGSSALFADPVGGITLEDKRELTRLLLTCGANIMEINNVRKHVSRVKGGRLAMTLAQGVRLINLTVSDVIGDPLDYITGPTVPDSSTLGDARSTLDRYALWQRVPPSVARHLRDAGEEWETPADADFTKLERRDVILVAGEAACVAASQRAREHGFEPRILSTMFEGESRELGRALAAIAKETIHSGRPVCPPCALIGGGETTVRIDGPAGSGGPNQEFVVSAALELAGMKGVVAAGLDTDGADGPTASAGGLVDGGTRARAERLGLDMFAGLVGHDVSPILARLGDTILTGSTGTNVNDLILVLVAARDAPGSETG